MRIDGTGGRVATLPDGTDLLNADSLRRACDFVIHDGRDAPAELRAAPPDIAGFLDRLEQVRDGDIVFVKSNLLDGFLPRHFRDCARASCW